MIKMRDYQQEFVNSIFAYWMNGGTGDPLGVAPTGAGKSIIIGGLVQQTLEWYPTTRIAVVTHVAELIEQNHEKTVTMNPHADVGIYSAGLKRRDDAQILFAGIQSFYKRAYEFDPFELIIVDECHTIPKTGDGMYQQFIRDVKTMNPNAKVIGLTATPFRLSSGMLTEGDDALFDQIVYDIPISLLIERGFLSPLRTRGSKKVADMTGVKKSGGDYQINAMAERFADITETAVADVVEAMKDEDRHHALLFCCNVDHAFQTRDILRSHGLTASTITGETPDEERRKIIQDFRDGKIQALTNCNVLTTGFDAPRTDVIVFLRATASAGLYVQMCGRGMRVAEGKDDCLVLDYGGNVLRHGCVDDVNPPSGRGKGEGAPPMKQCPVCDEILHAAIMECTHCGHVFISEKQAHDTQATDAPILKSQRKPKKYRVNQVTYLIHRKENKPPSLRVTYHSDGWQTFSEWICFEHGGYAETKAVSWFSERFTGVSMPTQLTTQAAHEIAVSGFLRAPESIEVDESEKYPTIKKHNFPTIEAKAS